MPHYLRYLLNSQPNDGTPGGGPSPAASTTPAPAQGNSSVEPSILEQIAKLMDSKLAEQENRTFANLRKAGVLGKAPKTEQSAEPQTQASHTSEDVQAVIARERAFNRAISTVKLSDTQFARMERAFQLEKPDDPAGWVKAWTADLGIGQQTEATGHQPTTPASTRSVHPVSDGGSPAPVTVPSDQQDPWRMSEDDVKSIIRRDGMAVAGAKFRQQFARSLNGRRIRLK